MTLSAKTEAGDALTVVGFDGNHVTVHSAKPYAPGQPMTMCVAIEPECRAEGRTMNTRRLPEGVFEVRLRLVSQTREDRLRLLEAMSDSRRD